MTSTFPAEISHRWISGIRQWSVVGVAVAAAVVVSSVVVVAFDIVVDTVVDYNIVAAVVAGNQAGGLCWYIHNPYHPHRCYRMRDFLSSKKFGTFRGTFAL